MKNKYLILITLFLLTGCSTHTYTKKQYTNPDKPQAKKSKVIKKEEDTKTTKSYQVTMKTKKFAFSDSSFIIEDENQIQIQVYSSGLTVGRLMFSKNEDVVCVKKLCNTKKWFNENFLSMYYPKNTIIDILKSQPIMDGKNLQQTKDGIIQLIKAYDYDITYRVMPNLTYFKDRKNRIIIKFKELDQ